MSLSPTRPVLLVDDDEDVLSSESLALEMAGITNLLTCADSRDVVALVKSEGCCVVVLDIAMPHQDGIILLERIAGESPDAVVIMLTGLDDVSAAVSCVKKGAFDYLVKPVGEDRLVTAILKAIEYYSVRAEASRLRAGLLGDGLPSPTVFARIATQDARLLRIFRYIEAVAPTGVPMLLTGETGVGKELFAEAIHAASGVRGEFVSINCAGIDDQLFSDTLFGHTREAYTGASGERAGLIARAKGGTLFLDEIGDLRAETQVKLLRLLQDGAYYRLGSDRPLTAETRFVAATNVDLHRAQLEGGFRKDLFFRLQAHEIRIPPLRERKGDLGLLLDALLKMAAEELGRKKPTVPPQLLALLRNYDFPGNVRELRGMVFDAVARHDSGVLSCEAFEEAILKRRDGISEAKAEMDTSASERVVFPGELPTIDEAEAALVAEALRRTEGNKAMAARLLGISRQTFRVKANKAGA